jgi:hypothetical protein
LGYFTRRNRYLIQKDVIEPVPQQDVHSGFYSTFFLVSKKNGKMRPVINLRPQVSQENSFQNGHFKQSDKSSET